MENKSRRLALITDIIQNEKINSQSALLKTLADRGCDITQATLSRDLKLLKVYKHPTQDGRYKYALPVGGQVVATPLPKTATAFDGFISIEFSGSSLAVIKTVPAFAQPISQAIDDEHFPSVIGTIAGNDTILLVIRDGFSPKSVAKSLIDNFPELIGKIQY